MDRITTRLVRRFLSARTTSPFLRNRPPPSPYRFITFSTLKASVPVSSALAAMTVIAYASAVSKPVNAADTPEEARNAPHHIKNSHGEHVKFKNPYPSAGEDATPWATFRKIVWAKLSGNFSTPDGTDAKIPSVKPEFLGDRTSGNALRATWLGHACYYVEFPSGLRVLFDPVFEDRCAPVQFMGPKRYTPPACSLDDLPAVDAVVISHSHYDHLSHTSVQHIAKKHPEAQFFVGLGLEKWFRASGIEKVTEMDWWQDAELTLKKKTAAEEKAAPGEITAKISCLPCQHSSGRTGRDYDHTLWASWAVVSGGKSVWFGGDTGYRKVPDVPKGADDYGPEYDTLPRCPQFEQIGRLRGPFDLGLIPIGAYHPRWLFSWMHANPYDAVEIFKDTKCKRAMGIHWGTWVLTSEEVEEPPKLLKKALAKSGIPETGVFDVCAIGETREF
ncbi:beta-lactamase superfamily domain-containing protein [Podospora australis]|uniref:Beta-lactamase superfamily domain-containing protein n=1 Tax=Podospora australis TaxID=1536484 RepID=A0AAN6WWU1_9PEZI|nr:beta-lactamase superfamily domain-containing protein [Podospora australis]